MPTSTMPPFAAALLHDGGLLLLAWLFGALVGWQREVQGRPAGLRTHALVCGASCLLSLLSLSGSGHGDSGGRIAAQIVSGVGFIGAGVILRRGVSVRGLTTAATIWVVSAIGIATGAGGHYAVLAGVTTMLTLVTLTFAKRIEQAIRREPRFVTLVATVPRRKGAVTRLIEVLTAAGATIASVDSESDEGGPGGVAQDRRTVHMTLDLPRGVTTKELSSQLTEEVPEVNFEWED